jgi:hypothetical protein
LDKWKNPVLSNEIYGIGMKIGDLVRLAAIYNSDIGFVLYVNEEGGTIKVLLSSGDIGWCVKSGCKVINESG